MKKKFDVEECIAELETALRVASHNFDIYRVLKDKDIRAKYADIILYKYPTYFKAAIHSHFVATLFALYKLYETRKDTYNINSIMVECIKIKEDKKIEENKIEDKISQIEEMISKAKGTWKKISILRNKIFGHRAFESIESLFLKANINLDEIKSLIEQTNNIIAEITLYIKNFQYSTFDNSQPVLWMLEDLKNYDLLVNKD